ncbi:MAG: hypothetical protein EA396_02310 [Anaerolineaceae bacterium]|nr:MAG: hypothetical protein EA396_02310 [Anaerolineaceae bacterium]
MYSRIFRLLILTTFLIFALILSTAPSFAEGDSGGPPGFDREDADLTCEQLLSAPVSSFEGRNYFVQSNGEDTLQTFIFIITLQADERIVFRLSGTGGALGSLFPEVADVPLLVENISEITLENQTIIFSPRANVDSVYGAQIRASGGVTIEVLDCGFPPACARGYPVLGQIMVTGDLEGYGQPGQDRISGLNVFNDANNDGFDTFDILDIVNDEDGNPAWYGIFLGGCDPVYVDASLVTRIR